MPLEFANVLITDLTSGHGWVEQAMPKVLNVKQVQFDLEGENLIFISEPI